MPYCQLSDEQVTQCQAAILQGQADIVIVPTQDGEVQLTINNMVVDTFDTYGEACDSIHYLANQ